MREDGQPVAEGYPFSDRVAEIHTVSRLEAGDPGHVRGDNLSSQATRPGG